MDSFEGLVLRIDPQRMEEQASFVRDDVENMKSNTLTMISEINSMKSYWKGEAPDLQQKQFMSLTDDLQQMYMILKEYSDDILKLAGLYKKNEIMNDEEAALLPSYNMRNY